MKIGLIQMDMAWEDKQANYIMAEEYLKQAKELGVSFCVFPEMSLTGFSMHVERIGETADALVTVPRFCEYAKQYEMYIGIGYVERKADGRGLNRYAIISPEGEVLCDYAKIHPFSFGKEGLFYDGGDKVMAAKVGDFTVCPLICYDLRFPDVFMEGAKEANMFIVPASWPQARMEAWKIFLQARAMENQAIVVGVNRIGQGGKIPYSGESMAVDADGSIIAGPFEYEGILVAEVDKASVDLARQVFPTMQDRMTAVKRIMGLEGE